MPSPANSPRQAPFATKSSYNLISDATDKKGQVWQKLSKANATSSKVVGYSEMSEPPAGGEATSCIDWNSADNIQNQKRYLKFDITFSETQQELELTDTNKYGAEENVQAFTIPSFKELSAADQQIVAAHGYKIQLEFKQDEMGHWLLKIDSKNAQNNTNGSSPLSVAKHKSLATQIASLTDTTSYQTKLTNAKQTHYQYISPYSTPAADPRFMTPANFHTLNENEKKAIYKQGINFHAQTMLRIASKPTKTTEDLYTIDDAFRQIRKLSGLTNEFFNGKNKQFSPEGFSDLVKILKQTNNTHYANHLTYFFKDQQTLGATIQEGDDDQLGKGSDEERLASKVESLNKTLKTKFTAKKREAEKAKNHGTPPNDTESGALSLEDLSPANDGEAGLLAKLRKEAFACLDSNEEQAPKTAVTPEELARRESMNKLTKEPIFKLDQAIKALNLQLERLYGVTLVPNQTRNTNEYTSFTLIKLGDKRTKSAETLAKLLFRTQGPNRDRSGGYFNDLLQQKMLENRSKIPGSGLINLKAKNAENLSATSLMTLFHEVGHACECFLNEPTTSSPYANGRLATDLKEIPSQLLEFMTTDNEVIKTLAASASNLNEEGVKERLNLVLTDNLKGLGCELALDHALLELLTKEQNEAPTFDGIFDAFKKKLPSKAQESINKKPQEWKLWMAHHIEFAMESYEEKSYQYPVGRVLAALVRKRLLDNPSQYRQTGKQLENWYKSSQSHKTPKQDYEFLNNLLKAWTPEEAVEALRDVSKVRLS